jgi:hypothetical protein
MPDKVMQREGEVHHRTKLPDLFAKRYPVRQRLRGGKIPAGWVCLHYLERRPPPRHVHVYRDGVLVVKWDLDNRKAMKSSATRRILELIAELESEGLL